MLGRSTFDQRVVGSNRSPDLLQKDEENLCQLFLILSKKRPKESRSRVTSRGRTRVALLRLVLCYSVVLLRSPLKAVPYEDSKESRGVVTSKRKTRVALLRLALVLFSGPSSLSVQTHTMDHALTFLFSCYSMGRKNHL